MSQYFPDQNVRARKSDQVWRSLGEAGEGDEEECRTSGVAPGVKLKPSPTLLSKVPFSSNSHRSLSETKLVSSPCPAPPQLLLSCLIISSKLEPMQPATPIKVHSSVQSAKSSANISLKAAFTCKDTETNAR